MAELSPVWDGATVKARVNRPYPFILQVLVSQDSAKYLESRMD